MCVCDFQRVVAMYGQEDKDGCMSSFMRLKFEKEAAKHWNRFYKQNQANFFKDRHYLEKEFDCLSQSSPAQDDSATKQNRNLLEVGCGVGNTVYPLLESHGDLYVHCCDFSQEAVRLVKEHDKYEQGKRVNAFVCDVTQDDLRENVPERTVDLATLIFVLSAIPPPKLGGAIENVARTLRPGARVLVRDYGSGDLAEERLESKQGSSRKLAEGYYIRGDGTFCVYFTEESLAGAFESRGDFVCERIQMQHRVIENRRKQVAMNRSWVQAVFKYSPGESEANHPGR